MSGQRKTLEEIWPGLEDGMTRILSNLNAGISPKAWMGLYDSVYVHCVSGRSTTTRAGTASGRGTSGANFVGEELYMKLQEFLTKHMRALLKVADSRMDESLLVYYRDEWQRYTTAMKYVNHIFEYLNRHWIKRESDDGKREVYEVKTLALVIWRDHMFQALKGRLTRAILTLVEKERNAEQIDTSLVQGVIEAYVALGLSKEKPKETTLEIYDRHFEVDFLEATELYYTAESSQFISSNSVADYMRKVETRLAEEVRRVQQYLHGSTESDLIKRCEQVLIAKHVETIWGEFQNLLQDDKIDDLTRMYSLLLRINQLEPLRTILEKHVQTVGFAAVQAVAAAALTDPKLYVETILKVFKKYNDLVLGPFRNDAGFVAALDKACRRFINDNEVCKQAKSASKSPELLARFCDGLLKKSAKMPEQAEMEQLLSDVMLVFKYIEDKDVFQTFYSKQLAKRLIHGASASEELEGDMISKLKASCGYEYTSKLQRMFNDMALSRDLLERYKTWAEGKAGASGDLGGVDFSILVLATGSWPLQAPSTNFVVPKELHVCEELFQKFYISQHNGRKLNWLHQLAKGEVRARLAGKMYTLQTSTYQLGVLVLFNQYESITLDEIQSATQLTDSALKNTALSLIKSTVLVSDSGETLEKGTKLSVNSDFKSKKLRVNINVPVREEEKKAGDDIHKEVEEDRKLQIQAAIVRIMKTRKRLQHNNLITEVVNQLSTRFQPKIPVIKKCIDVLIEKEYLERIANAEYSYLA